MSTESDIHAGVYQSEFFLHICKNRLDAPPDELARGITLKYGWGNAPEGYDYANRGKDKESEKAAALRGLPLCTTSSGLYLKKQQRTPCFKLTNKGPTDPANQGLQFGPHINPSINTDRFTGGHDSGICNASRRVTPRCLFF